MKKKIMIILMVCSCILFGCKKDDNNITCTLVQDVYIGTALESLEISYQKDLIETVDVMLEIEINEGYEDFAQSYYDDIKNEYTSLEKLYNIKYDITEYDNGITIKYNTDFETFKNIYDVITSNKKDVIIKTLNDKGYTCK